MTAAVTGATWSLAGTMSTTATLRAFVAQVRTAMTAAGMVRTSDTGQIDPTTVTWAGTAALTHGYEVWRLDDTLQSTKPVYLKLRYFNSASGVVQIAATASTATDGAGTLTSATNTGVSVTAEKTFCPGAGAAVANIRQSWIYGDKSGVFLAINPDAAPAASTTNTFGGHLWLERTRSADGTPNGDGFVFAYTAMSGATSPTTLSSFQTVVWGLVPTQPGEIANTGGIPIVGASGTSGIVGTDVFTLPALTGNAPRVGGPSNIIIGMYRDDYAAGATFDVTHYGSSRTFACAKSGAFKQSIGMSGALNPELTYAVRTT